jgi:hypothetical protein
MSIWKAALVSAGLVTVLAAAPAVVQGPEMEIAKKATLVDGGQGALLRVTAACPVGGELLESFVYVNQDGNSTEWGAVNIPCDGMPHSRTVRVTALDFTLHKGKASASGYMLLTSGETISPVQPLKLKWPNSP